MASSIVVHLSPLNAIGGVGFFSSHTFLPISVAWEVFGNRNGAETFEQFRNMIMSNRKDKDNPNPQIGCIVLTNPVFFKGEDWIETPSDWSNSIVQGKSYSIAQGIGKEIWEKVELLLETYLTTSAIDGAKSQLILEEPEVRYSNVFSKVRLGQGAFRVLVTDSYQRRCAITGEKTLPVLEAAHIKPYAVSGPHYISNGLLLRSDMHRLFDTRYITVTKDLKIEVSKRIKEEFQNGREYYQYHGKDLLYLPQREIDRPACQYIDWHNENIFRS